MNPALEERCPDDSNRSAAKLRAFIGFLLLQCAFVSPTNATTPRSYSPAPGSAERKAICNAMRHYVLKDVITALPKPILFHVQRMVVADGFCSFEGYPVFNDGSSIGTEFLPSVVYETGLERQGVHWVVVYDLTKADPRNSAELAEIRKSFPRRFPHEILPVSWRDRLLRERTDPGVEMSKQEPSHVQTTPGSEEDWEKLKQRSAQLDERAAELDRRTAELDHIRKENEGDSASATAPVPSGSSQSTGTQANRESNAESEKEFLEAFRASPAAFKADQLEKDKVYKITGRFTQYFTIMQVVEGTILIGDPGLSDPQLIAVLLPQNPEALETANIPRTLARATGTFSKFIDIELATGVPRRLPVFVISGLSLEGGRYIEMKKK